MAADLSMLGSNFIDKLGQEAIMIHVVKIRSRDIHMNSCYFNIDTDK